MQAWIFIEVIFFLCWIAGGCIFLIIAYSSKMKTFLRTEEELLADMNPWNNEDTEDFLRHLKFEFYTMNFQLACILVEITMGFVDVFGLNMYGEVEFKWIGLSLLVAMVPRICMFFGWLMLSRSGLGARSHGMRNVRIGFVIVNLMALACFVTLFALLNEEFRSVNKVTSEWLLFEMVSKVVEPAYLLNKICCRAATAPRNAPYTL